MILDENVIQLWFHYEEVAMHFNELIIQYRLALMGGIGAIGTAASYIINMKTKEEIIKRKLIANISLVLLLLFVAAASLDIFYYNELLLGAVDAVLQFENEHKEIYLSTKITKRFTNSETMTIYVIYGIILFLFIAFTIISWFRLATYKKQA